MFLKKVFCLILALFLANQAIFSFGGRAPETVVGFINYYGNAPVEFAGFETVDGYVYTLQVEEGAKFSLKDIEAEQGNMLELTGQIDKSQKNGFQVLKDGIFIVSDWKKL